MAVTVVVRGADTGVVVTTVTVAEGLVETAGPVGATTLVVVVVELVVVELLVVVGLVLDELVIAPPALAAAVLVVSCGTDDVVETAVDGVAAPAINVRAKPPAKTLPHPRRVARCAQ